MRQGRRHRGRVATLVAIVSFLLPGSSLLAQGVTTASIRGVVRASDGGDTDGARVEVRHAATGFVVEADVRHGQFLVHGLQVGGPYTVVVVHPGFVPQRRTGLFLTLGEPLELGFLLESSAIEVDTLRVAVRPLQRADPDGGTATTIPDSLLHRLPSLDRNLYDFVHLAAQVSTRIGLAAGGLSGGGVGFRFNNFLIQGVPQRSFSGSQPREFAGGKSIPFEAVSEYRILLAPFDVRYGDFAGALINAVTRSGTNELEGSAFAFGRNDALSRDDAATPYERLQYGFHVGGPVVRDRFHFFVATELQHLTSPAPGPYLGQPPAATSPVPVSEADLASVERILQGYGLAAGSGGPVENENPLRNVFARLDVALPEWSSRGVLWVNDVDSSDLAFARAQGEFFPLSSHAAALEFAGRTTALQLHTELGRTGGSYNELQVSHRADRASWSTSVEQPIVNVTVPGVAGDAVTIVTGTPEQAQGPAVRSRHVHVRDDLTLPLGASHVATLGFEVERFRLEGGGATGSYGAWTFSSLDSLGAGVAERYQVRRDLGSASGSIHGGQYAAWIGDRWQASDRVSVTLGLRADLLALRERAPYNPVVDSIFGRRTDLLPHRRVHLSPRLGFTWDAAGTGRDRLRGGVGVFTGRPPLAWFDSALSNYGVGIGFLRCGELPSDAGLPPAFVPDLRAAPVACADGAGLATAPRGDVDLLARDLRMARTLRFALAWDRELPWDLLATGEALVTRTLSDFVFVNLNLEGPQGIDRNGRVLYGGPVGPGGLVAPALRSDFSEVIDVVNTSASRAYALSARVEKRSSGGVAGVASYTFSRVRDVQTPIRVNTPGTVNWASRAVSGRHDDLSAGISLNDVPHRFVLAGTMRAPWSPWSTEFALYYVGESGSPFTYRAWGVGRRGDLNADGSNLNDPIYVPRDAFDPDDILFSGLSDAPGDGDSPAVQVERVRAQQAAFERFVEGTPCLRRQRGRILERNSCREPWTHTTVLSVRQAIPIGGLGLEAEVDVFNVLDLLGTDWGDRRVAVPALLEQVGRTAGGPETAQPVFRFDTTAPRWTTLTTESAFHLQLAVRYRF